jgi:hypothetical protein
VAAAGDQDDAVVLARRSDPAELARARAVGAVERVRWGAYLPVVPSQGRGRDARRRALARIAAVHAQLSVEHWFSHESAAVLWGCDTVRLSEDVHLLQQGRPARRGRERLVRHHGDLPVSHRGEARGLPVTSPERTLVDCAATLPQDRALVIVDSGLRLGADPATTETLLAARSGTRGIARARAVWALADARAESPGETLTRHVLHQRRLPPPDLQVPVATRRGVFRLDLGWPAQRLGLEFDGLVKYSGAFGRTAPEAVFAEKRRQDAIEDEGWRVVRVTWADLAAPAELADRVARALARPHR